MLKIVFVICGVICGVQSRPAPAPQDLQTGALMLVGQMKDIMENGAAARNSKDFEFLGAKMSNNMEMGFGDAMKSGRRGRRDILSESLLRLKRDASDKSSSDYSSSTGSSSSSGSSSSYASSESEER